MHLAYNASLDARYVGNERSRSEKMLIFFYPIYKYCRVESKNDKLCAMYQVAVNFCSAEFDHTSLDSVVDILLLLGYTAYVIAFLA